MVAFVEEYTFHFLYVHLCYFWEVLDHNAFSGLVAQMCQWSLNFQLLACCSYIDSYIGHLSAFFFLLFFCAANMQILAYRLFNAQQVFHSWMCLADPSTLVKVQDYIRETKHHMEHERNQRIVLENKLRLIVKEKQELHRYQPHSLNTQVPWVLLFYWKLYVPLKKYNYHTLVCLVWQIGQKTENIWGFCLHEKFESM